MFPKLTFPNLSFTSGNMSYMFFKMGEHFAIIANEKTNFLLNPFAPKSDKHLNSSNSINLDSNIKITRIKEMTTGSVP